MAPRVPSFSTTGAVDVQPLVLLVDDEPAKQHLLISALATNGCRCLRAVGTTNALTQALRHGPQLVLLDAGPPGIDAVGLTARLRAWTSAPIIVLLSPSCGHERTALLDAGANDYVVQPLVVADLVARMRVWLRQQSHRPTYEPGAKRLRIDRDRWSIFVEGRETHLTPIEFKLLLALSRRPGATMTEAQVLASVWGKGPMTRAQLREHVRRLKQKIERDPARPAHLLTETGGGYRLNLG
jgi:two-component system KDP operon response regulator KdpE